MLIEATSFVARITRANRLAILACSILKHTGTVRQHRNSDSPRSDYTSASDLGDSRCRIFFGLGSIPKKPHSSGLFLLGGRQLHLGRQHPFSRRRDPQRRRHRPDVVEELTPRHHQAATHEPNQDVGRDVLGRENSLSAATGVGSDDLERTTPDVGRTPGGLFFGLSAHSPPQSELRLPRLTARAHTCPDMTPEPPTSGAVSKRKNSLPRLG